MLTRPRYQFFVAALILLGCLVCAPALRAQDVDGTGEEPDDPGKLFLSARRAQERNELERALTLYDEAIKLRPEYPEAEYQRGLVFIALKRLPEAEQALLRAAKLRSEWSLPQTALGQLYAQQGRDKDAEPYLRHALELDADDLPTLITYAQLWLRAGEKDAALTLFKRATTDENAPADAWAARGTLERAAGDDKAAAASLRRALALDANNVVAREERAEMRAAAHDYARAAEDLQFLLRTQPKAERAKLWQQRLNELQTLAARQAAGDTQTGGAETGGAQTNDALPPAPVPAETLEAANSDDPKIARPALVTLLQADPKNAVAHARLCAIDRANDPSSALAHCRSAVELQPKNPDYATGYAAALVQARRFAEAVSLLRQVLAVAPGNYAAHANLATALDELQDYAAALAEYRWLNRARPELAAVYFLIARDLDLLGEYEQALAAYETFLARADAVTNKDEIGRVNLRLPALRRQIARGVKKRKP
jgi:tetratricopeptide (TPR) repeat protein